jgi:cell division protein FtsB
MNMRVAKAVADRSAEYERRFKAVEDAARAREHAQAIIHAQEKQELQEKLANMQKEMDLWKMRFTIAVSALTIAVATIVFLLFKILASPIVLSAMVLLLVVSLALLRRYFPEIFAAMFKFFLWMLQNPSWGLLFLAIVVAVFYFRKRLFKKVFGETKMEKLQAENAKLKEEINSLKTNVLTQKQELLEAKAELTKLAAEIQGHRTPEVNVPPSHVQAASGGAAVDQKMFSESPPSRQGLTLPAHTPIHDISSP